MKKLLDIPSILTPFIRFMIRAGSKRMEYGILELLWYDMNYITTHTSGLINMYWDIIGGNYPDQYHHKPKDCLLGAFKGAFTIIWLLFLSYLPWNWRSKTRN